jgi:hypothetical protein
VEYLIQWTFCLIILHIHLELNPLFCFIFILDRSHWQRSVRCLKLLVVSW